MLYSDFTTGGQIKSHQKIELVDQFYGGQIRQLTIVPCAGEEDEMDEQETDSMRAMLPPCNRPPTLRFHALTLLGRLAPRLLTLAALVVCVVGFWRRPRRRSVSAACPALSLMSSATLLAPGSSPGAPALHALRLRVRVRACRRDRRHRTQAVA